MTHLGRLRDFVVALTHIVERAPATKRRNCGGVRPCSPNWSVTTTGCRTTTPRPIRNSTGSICCTPIRSSRFSVVSFVWGPGQKTPVHDHRTWGLVGILRGAELRRPTTRAADGLPAPGRRSGWSRARWWRCRRRSATSMRSPTPTTTASRSASTSMAAISARSRRAVFDPATGEEKLVHFRLRQCEPCPISGTWTGRA